MATQIDGVTFFHFIETRNRKFGNFVFGFCKCIIAIRWNFWAHLVCRETWACDSIKPSFVSFFWTSKGKIFTIPKVSFNFSTSVGRLISFKLQFRNSSSKRKSYPNLCVLFQEKVLNRIATIFQLRSWKFSLEQYL